MPGQAIPRASPQLLWASGVQSSAVDANRRCPQTAGDSLRRFSDLQGRRQSIHGLRQPDHQASDRVGEGSIGSRIRRRCSIRQILRPASDAQASITSAECLLQSLALRPDVLCGASDKSHLIVGVLITVSWTFNFSDCVANS